MNNLMRGLLAVSVVNALLVSGSASAENLFIRNAKVHTLADSGVIEGANILIRGDRIVAVGKDVQADADSRIIDAQGRDVTPGLMNAHSGIGAVEIDALTDTVDHTTADTRFGASFDLADVINPDSSLIPYNRMMGLTRAVVSPGIGHGIFGGQSLVIHLGQSAVQNPVPQTPVLQNPVLQNKVAMIANFRANTEGSRAAGLLAMRAAFEDARDYRDNKAAFQRGERREYSLPFRDLEALLPVIEGKQLLIVTANRAQDLRTLLRMKKDFGLRLAILGAAEGHRVASELAAEQVAVILAPMENTPDSFDTLGASLENAARLHKAGVRIAFTSNAGDSPSHNAHLARQGAGNAVAHGLPAEAALAALTVNPAQLFGLADRYGKIAAGFDADLVIWSGDPLEVTSYPDAVIIRGENQSLVSRQTLLRDRYRQAGNDPGRAYR